MDTVLITPGPVKDRSFAAVLEYVISSWKGSMQTRVNLPLPALPRYSVINAVLRM